MFRVFGKLMTEREAGYRLALVGKRRVEASFGEAKEQGRGIQA
jgi:hypothetical protein